jgi:hypothetical protein
MPLKHKVNPETDLTLEFLKSRVEYDPAHGVFLWRNGYGGRISGGLAGRKTTPHRDGGYWRVTIDNREYKAHRLAWFYMTGEWPSPEIDHINGDGLDNRWSNLRLATKSQNKANNRRYKNNKSGFKGVSWSVEAQKWHATIQVKGKQIYLGRFTDIREAAEAYRKAAAEHHGAFSRTT